MRRTHLLAAAIVTLMGASSGIASAASSDWVAVGQGRFLDVRSLYSVGVTKRIWMKTVSTRPGDQSYDLSLLSFDCPNRKFGLLALIRYAGDGTLIKDTQFPDESKSYWYTQPDTMYWQLDKMLCRRER